MRERFNEELQTGWLGRTAEFHNLIVSTNDLAKARGAEGFENGLVIFAEQQTAGRGRMGRSWQDVPGEGLLFSLLLKPQIRPELAPYFTLTTAVGVAAALNELGFPVGIKWPNDLLLNGKKLGGILTEMQTTGDKVDFVVVGIGLNVLQADFEEDIKDIAISMRQFAPGAELDRAKIAAAVLNSLEYYYELLLKEGFVPIRAGWLKYNVTIGRQVLARGRDGEVCGVAVDMDAEGELLLRLDNDEVITVRCGEVIFAK